MRHSGIDQNAQPVFIPALNFTTGLLGTPNTQPGQEGRAGGTGPAVEEDRELPAQCLHRHSHTNRTLDSLDNVDRPLSLPYTPAEFWMESQQPVCAPFQYLLIPADKNEPVEIRRFEGQSDDELRATIGSHFQGNLIR